MQCVNKQLNEIKEKKTEENKCPSDAPENTNTDRNDEGNPMDFNQNEIQSEDRNIKEESR